MSDSKRDTPGRGAQGLAASISATLGVAGTASAQTSGGLETIVVTATRRAENLQNVPESISAFDSEAIEMRGLKQMDDYAKFVPGLSLGVREPGGTTIVFRGVASSGIQFGAVSSSALYLDEQPITQSGNNPDPRLIDIERLEALRGPQGTLYGASSQSGTLRVITNKPDPSEFDAWVDGQVSSIQDGGTGYDVSAMVNVPLVEDRLALRLVGFTAEDAGFIDNVLSESPRGQMFAGEGTFNNADQVDEDVNSSQTSGARAALRWDVTDSVDLTLGALFQDLSTDGNGDVDLGVGDLNQVRFEDESLDDKWYQVAMTLNASLPFGDLVLSASYFDRDFHYEADATAYEFTLSLNYATYTVYDYGPLNNGSGFYDSSGGDPRGFATDDEQTEIKTFEARLQSRGDSESRWAWMVGAFYSEEKQHSEFDSFMRGYEDTVSFYYMSGLSYFYTGNFLDNTERWFLGRYDIELEQVAVFGELSFDLTENFTITAGARWFDYDRRFAQIQEQPEGFRTLDDDTSTSEDGSVVKLNATYRFDEDRLMYATYSEGFRVGGSNPLKAGSVLPREYSSDEVKNYEIGLKSEWLENRLRFNVAAYFMQWDDFSVQLEDPQAIFQLGFVNLASAEIPGAEAEFAFSLNENWQLDGAFSWNDGETSEDTTLVLGEDLDLFVPKGERLPLTPDWTATVGIEYRASAQWFNAQPFARFDFAYVGESVNSLEGIESVVNLTPVDTQDAYETSDLRLGLDGDRWSASLFVDNIWDERAELFFNNRWGVQRLSINPPRTYGLQLRFQF